VLGLIVLINLRGAGRLWIAATALVVLMMSLNSVCNAIAFVELHSGAGGNWVWWIPLCVRVVGEACVIVTMAGAELTDRLHHAQRDWLHLGGMLAALGLGVVDLAVNAPPLWR
jgi:hypothetical protein